jgi:hypothetical protein
MFLTQTKFSQIFVILCCSLLVFADSNQDSQSSKLGKSLLIAFKTLFYLMCLFFYLHQNENVDEKSSNQSIEKLKKLLKNLEELDALRGQLLDRIEKELISYDLEADSNVDSSEDAEKRAIYTPRIGRAIYAPRIGRAIYHPRIGK